MMTSSIGTRTTTRRRRRGFTLIELIAVMALLALMSAFAAPKFARFFHGRDVTEEARRFLALTRYARSEAVSRAVPMKLWVAVETGAYGVAPEWDHSAGDRTAFAFVLAPGVYFELDREALEDEDNAIIRFWPDGTIDAKSLEQVRIWDGGDSGYDIQLAEYGVRYVLEGMYDEERDEK